LVEAIGDSDTLLRRAAQVEHTCVARETECTKFWLAVLAPAGVRGTVQSAIFARAHVYDLTICARSKPGWRNGIRRGLKILWSESSVRVRPPPPAFKKRCHSWSSNSTVAGY
jgi:hypothetical protein